MTRRLMAVRSLMVVAVIAAALLAVVKTAGPAHSSTTVTDMSHGISAPQLAQAIVGSGITVSNVSYTGSPLAAGTFTGNGTAPSGIGFPSGIVMSTGLVQTTGSLTSCPKGVEGPNNCDPNSSDLGQPGDTDLSALAGASANPPVANAQTFDASVLNFDFVPNQSSSSISYVFGSEEYNQFVGSQFNDAFGFFVNGHNCALLPDGSPVTVNNVNGNKNASLFRTNLPKPGGIDTEFNGITTVLTCTAAVTQGQTNHMKLAIADTADGGFDSGVYIQGGSFNAGPPPGTTPSTIASNGSNTIQGTIVNSDNVPQQGALAQACILNTLPPQCLALATTDANGNYSIPNVPSNQWVVVGFPPASTDTETLNFVQPVVTAGGALVVAPDIVLKVVGAPPPGTVFATPDGVENNGKPPALNWGDPTGIAIPSCVGAGSATLTITGEDGFSGKTITVTVPLSETSPGVYTGTIPPLMPMHGNANFHVDINCPNPPPDWGGWIDPSGTVTTPSGVPIPGATVTLTRSDTANGTQAPVPSGSAIMSPGNRTNPVTTGGDGVFAWDVVGGFYQVSASKSGCTAASGGGPAAQSPVFPIPPPMTGINLQLNCPSAAITRLFGNNRIGTAIAISNNSFPQGGSAKAVVVANAFAFPDALAGTPLAAVSGGPLLLTPGDALDPAVASEISRVLPPGGTVYLLGGTTAMSPAVQSAITGAGFKVVRFGGINRFDTAAIIADQGLHDPATVFEATGLNFPDALAAGAAAIKTGAAILLTAGSAQANETAAYMSAHHPQTTYALGGPAHTADPNATPIVGATRFETAIAVATKFFPGPARIALANGLAFPDALAGGVHIGTMGGPLILVPPSAPIPSVVANYLAGVGSGVATFAYGGTAAIADAVLAEAAVAIG